MIDMKAVQTVTLGGERFVILPEAEFIKLAGAPREPELPPRDAKGNRPAMETARALMARKLIRARAELGWSQVELGRRSGVRPETINRIEQAKRSPTLATFEKLYRALDEGKPATGNRNKRKGK
jgi:DNA-binding XRE family transcriptional regulator